MIRRDICVIKTPFLCVGLIRRGSRRNVVNIRLVCLDLAGTTVSDDGAVERAFMSAVATSGIEVGSEDDDIALAVFRQTRGRSKIEVFRLIFGNENDAVTANRAFEQAYAEHVDAGSVRALPGAEETIVRLRDAGIRICLTTGFAPVTRDKLMDRLDWDRLVELALTPEDVGRGRPYPDMILAAARQLDIDDLTG